MKPLPLILRKNGFSYVQVLRTRRSCIYRQEVGEYLQYFEVFKVTSKPSTYFKGQLLPEREIFPCDEFFGKTAKTFRNIEDAMNRFNQLVEKEKQEGQSNDRSDKKL